MTLKEHLNIGSLDYVDKKICQIHLNARMQMKLRMIQNDEGSPLRRQERDYNRQYLGNSEPAIRDIHGRATRCCAHKELPDAGAGRQRLKLDLVCDAQAL